MKRIVGLGIAIIAVLALVLSLPALAKNNDQTTAPAPASGPLWTELDGTSWQLAELNGAALVDGSVITLEIDGDRVAGSAGCNRYNGQLEVDGDQLAFGPLMGTRMFCGQDGLMDQENAFQATLAAVDSFDLSGESLTLSGPDGDLLFAPAEGETQDDTTAQDEAQVSNPVQDQPLENVRWTLAIDAGIWLEFADGQMSGSAGCNNIFGGYELDGEQLTLGPVGSTMMACSEEQMARETEFLAALANVSAFHIEAGSLALNGPDGVTLINLAQ